MADVSSTNRLRYNSLQSLAKSQRLRYRSPGSVLATHRTRYSTSAVARSRRLRYASQTNVKAARKLRYMATTADADRAWQQGIGELDVNLSVDNAGTVTSLGEVPHLLQITLEESGPIKWQLSIIDPTGAYHPKRSGGTWAGLLDARAFASDGSYAKKFLASITWGGVEFNLVGIPTSYGHTRSFRNAGRFDFSWGGLDVSRKLFSPGVTLPTLRSSLQAGFYTTKSAIANLLDAQGLRYNLDAMEAALIRVQHRQDSRPGDLMQQLCDVLFTRWQVRGETIHFYQPQYTGPPQWRYGGSNALLPEDSLDVQAPSTVNSVTARRAAESKAQAPPVEHTTFGTSTLPFNPPVDSLSWSKLTQQNGLFSDFILKDSNGNVVAVRENRAQTWPTGLVGAPAHNIASVTYTWGAVPGFIGSGGYGKIRFEGKARDREDQGWVNDGILSVTKTVPASIHDFGPQHQELQANPLIADGGTLGRHAELFLREQAANQEPQSFRAELNLGLYPGQRVLIDDEVLGIQEVRYVRRVTHSISDDPAQRFTRFETIYFDPNLVVA